ncbi:hypothetical protein B0H11DRAFT_2208813 [Mycena galericulata]|nr:hypothetical protein B0H11DRAFT_2208813 [Mycena galericulata]
MAVEVSSVASRDRRRSLKALLQLPLFPRTSGHAHNAISAVGALGPRVSLPEDVLREVVEDMSPADMLNLSLTSSHVRALLIPELYRTMQLRSSRACASGLRMLAKRPALCAHVTKLAVRPNYYLAWPTPDTPLNESWVAEMIRAIAPRLTRLRIFDWDGLEMPRDELWLTLRKSCPELKELYSNVGYEPLDPESELFKFSDLASFSLSVRHGLRDLSPLPFPPPEPLPPQLWTMLLTRCAPLTSLTLTSFSASARLFDLSPLPPARFPLLTALTLGTFGYSPHFALDILPAAPFRAFLAAHPALAYLRVGWNFKRWMSPEDVPSIAPDADADADTLLPSTEDDEYAPAAKLTAFSGIIQQLTSPASGTPLTLTSLTALTTLDLMHEPLYAPRFALLLPLLRALPLLRSLEIWVHVAGGGVGVGAGAGAGAVGVGDNARGRNANARFFGEMCGAAPGLEDLHFMCTTAFGKKPLTDLARALRLLPRLRAFALTKGHRYVDESMRASALRVWRALAVPVSPASHSHASSEPATDPDLELEEPRAPLTQVSIRWARAACRNHLKQEGTYERVVVRAVPSAAGFTSPTALATAPSSASALVDTSLSRDRKKNGGKGAAWRRGVSNTEKGRGRESAGGENKNTQEWKRDARDRDRVEVEAWERGLRAVGGAFDRQYRFAMPE